MSKRRWWQVEQPKAGRAFACPICRHELRGGGNGALAAHFRSRHPHADWMAHRRTA